MQQRHFMTTNMTQPMFSERKNRLQEYVEHCAPASERKTAKATGRYFSSTPMVVNIDNSDRRWFSIGGGTTHHHAPAAPKSDEDRKAARDTAAIVAGIAGVIAAVAGIGYGLKRLKETKEDYNRSWEAISDLFEIHTKFGNEALPTVGRLVTTQSQVDEERYRKYFYLTIEATVILAGSAALLVGGLTSAPLLITAGVIMTVAGVALALGTLIYYSGSRNENEVSRLASPALKELKNFTPRSYDDWVKDEEKQKPINYNRFIPVGIPVTEADVQAYFAPSAPPAELDPDAIPERETV